MKYHAIQLNDMLCYAIPCNTMQYHAIPCNTMQYHGTLKTADGAYHCPVGSRMAIFSSVRSSNSHPDLLVIHPTHFFRSHRSSTLDFHFLSHNSYIKAIMLYKGKIWQDSGILWHTLAYSSILWHTLAYTDILWHTLAYSCILWQTLANFGILWLTLAYSCILTQSLANFSKLWHTLAYSGILWHTL